MDEHLENPLMIRSLTCDKVIHSTYILGFFLIVIVVGPIHLLGMQPSGKCQVAQAHLPTHPPTHLQHFLCTDRWHAADCLVPQCLLPCQDLQEGTAGYPEVTFPPLHSPWTSSIVSCAQSWGFLLSSPTASDLGLFPLVSGSQAPPIPTSRPPNLKDFPSTCHVNAPRSSFPSIHWSTAQPIGFHSRRLAIQSKQRHSGISLSIG